MPPPENDDDAFAMADKIRKWIANGRPKPGQEKKIEEPVEEPEEEPEEIKEPEEDKVKEDKEKSKKKGLFGWLKK